MQGRDSSSTIVTAASPPESAPTLVPSLISIAKSTRQLLAMKLAEIDVAVGQDHLLEVLNPEQATSVGMMADVLSVRPSTVSKMLDRIVEKGWASRETNDQDQRKTFVRLTSSGIDRQRQVRAVWETLDQDLTKSLSGDERSAMVDGMHQMSTVLTKRLSRLR